MRITHRTIPTTIIRMCMHPTDCRQAITAAISSREITKNMVRVKSSNIWAYNINVKDNKRGVGDVYVQFKGRNGGPGEVYCFYDVPTRIYQKWHSALSKGHFFWQYIRGKYTYAKLTGDKKTKQKGGVNS